MENYAEATHKVLDTLKEDFVAWCERAGITNKNLDEVQYVIHPGNKYDKIVKVDGNSMSSIGFIVKKETAKFSVGTLLKSDSWKKPATNFARGDIFDTDTFGCLRWTGVM